MSTRGRKSTKKVEKAEEVVEAVSSEEETKQIFDDNDYDEIVKKTTEELKEVKFETNDPDVETPPQPKQKSIADFDYTEIESLDTGSVKALDTVTLLKLLIVRGKKALNPTLWKGVQETLRRLNGELGSQDFGNRRRDFNHGRDFNQGRNRFPPRNQAPQMQQEQHTEERQERPFDRQNQDRQFDRRSGPRDRNFRPQGRDNFQRRDDSNFGSRFQ